MTEQPGLSAEQQKIVDDATAAMAALSDLGNQFQIKQANRGAIRAFNALVEAILVANSRAYYKAALKQSRSNIQHLRTQLGIGMGRSETRTNQIRLWAAQNGYPVGERGKIASQVVDAYYQAHSDQRPEDTHQEDT